MGEPNGRCIEIYYIQQPEGSLTTENVIKNVSRFSMVIHNIQDKPITITQPSTVMKSKEDNIAGFFPTADS